MINVKVMKNILIILFGIFLLCSCSQKICLTTHDGSRSKTFKYRGDVVIDDDYVRFETAKGTKQSVPKDMYDFKIMQ
jgi:hypothetical protein